MIEETSPDTKAILLLTSMLGARSSQTSVQPLTQSEYRRVARELHELKCSPSALTSNDTESQAALSACAKVVDSARLRRLLARGLLLAQALERWSARGIWVASKLDANYPERLRATMRAEAPAVLYGAGDPALCTKTALGIVGSRNADSDVSAHTEAAARFAADNGITVVSGGAKGVDRTAMLAALARRGTVVGLLADSLERSLVEPAYRDALRAGHLLLISPFDPQARFQVWTAMQRNKLIYACSDAVLVMESAAEEGGTWAGAIEQLDRFRYAPVFVRAEPPPSAGLTALRSRGALVWPGPADRESFINAVAIAGEHQVRATSADQLTLEPPVQEGGDELAGTHPERSATALMAPLPGVAESVGDVPAPPTDLSAAARQDPIEEPKENASDELFAHVRSAIFRVLDKPRSATEVAERLDVTKVQAKTWLDRMVSEQHLSVLKRGLYSPAPPGLPFA